MCTSSHAVNAAVRKSVPYDSVNSFVAVSLVASVPDMLVVNASSPYRTLADIIAAAKKEPGKLTFASAGPGSYSDLDAELLKTITNIDMLQVPYRGGTPAITGLMANETQMLFLSLPGLVPQIKAGRLRAIAVTTPTRSALFPQVPTMAEAGASGYATASWYGVLLPAKTPPAIAELLNRRINEALKQPDVPGTTLGTRRRGRRHHIGLLHGLHEERHCALATGRPKESSVAPRRVIRFYR